jgi:copper transport protein
LAVASVAVAGWAMPAFGHAVLQSTDPASGTVLARSPGTVVLHFGEAVEIQFGAIRVFDSSSKRVDTGGAYHPNGDGRAVAINIPKSLADSGYVVTWRVISADSHPVHGAFTFLIGSDKATSAEATRVEAARLLATSGGSRSVGVLFGADRFASFLALFVLIGGAALVVGAWPEGRSDPRAQRLLLAGLVGAIVTTALAIGLQGAYGGGLPLSKMFSPAVAWEVLRTRFGEVYLLRLLILVLAAVPLVRRLFAPAALPRWWRWVGVATAGGLLVTPGLAGHAAAGSLVALAIPFDLVHLAGAAVWVGGLAMLAVTVLIRRSGNEGPSPLATVARRFSQWALISVLAIAVSGGFAAWRQIGSLSAVTTTTFGRLVLAKTIIFVVLIAVASRSRRLIHGSLHVPFLAAGRPRPAAVTRASAAVSAPSHATAATPATSAATPTAAPVTTVGSATTAAPATAAAPATTTALEATAPATSAPPATAAAPTATEAATAAVPARSDAPTATASATSAHPARSDAPTATASATSVHPAMPDAPTATASATSAPPATSAAPTTTAPATAAPPANSAAPTTTGATATAVAAADRADGASPTATARPGSPGPGPGPGAMAAPTAKRATWGAGGGQRSRPVRRRTKAQRQSDLRKTVLVEVFLAAVIVAVSAVLVNAQPARQALSKPFSAEVHAGPNVLVDVVVDPAKAGPVAIHLYTLSADGGQLDVPEVTASMSLASAGIANLNVPLQKGGAGHFLVGGFQVPLRGTWTLNITVRTTEFDEFNATPVRVHMR